MKIGFAQKINLRILRFIFLTFCTVCFTSPARTEPIFINRIPDLTQTDVRGDLYGNGQQFCAPVAVSNSIFWLAKMKQGQVELAEKLASSSYMNTSLKNGTGTTGVLNGVDRIARELFGSYERLEYQGWRKHPAHFSTNIKVPQLKWIQSGVSDRSSVWINVGWYRYDRASQEYERIGGHWVTVVGSDSDTLIIHDPSPRAGQDPAREYVRVNKMSSGTLTGNKAGLPIAAKEFYSLSGGMHLKSNAEYAIIDGAVILEL